MEQYRCDVCGISCSGIEPYVQHMKSNKHKKKEEQKNLLETTDNVEKNFFCYTCGIPCSGIVPYQQHMASDKHLKKEHAKQFSGKYQSSAPSNYEMGGSSATLNSVCPKRDECYNTSSEMINQKENYTGLPVQNSFSCEVCNKYFTGFAPFEQHMNGSVHKKKLQKIGLQSALDAGRIDVLKNEEPAEKQTCLTSSLESDNLRKKLATCVKTQFRCNLCEEGFPSQEIYNLHMLSLVHRTKQETLPSEDTYFCAVCNIKCTGLIPYEQHMNGALHQKNAKMAGLFAKVSREKNSKVNANPSNEENTNPGGIEKSSVSSLALHKLHNIDITGSNSVLAECYICNMKFYSSVEIKKHYESEIHYDNQNIYEYKKKVSVFAPEDPFSLST